MQAATVSFSATNVLERLWTTSDLDDSSTQQSPEGSSLRVLPKSSSSSTPGSDRNVASASQDEVTDPDFEHLVEQYHAALYRFAFSLTRSEADAWDLTQQTFYTWRIKGWQLRDGAKVKAWLFTTMHRTFLQSQRRENRFPHYELGEVEPELPGIAPIQESRVDSSGVLDALAEMDEIFRVPLALFYLDECPYKEIARILKVPLGTVKSRIARGIARLQEKLMSDEADTLREAA
jgi:RNA polymerase sigma-70 factor (ECF subfamily)